MIAFVFDVDGTLTPSRSKMDPAFQTWFLRFQATHDTYLVTGSDYDKTVDQVGWQVIDSAKMVFNCCGNEVRRGAELIHQAEWKPDIDLLTALEAMLAQSKFGLRTGNHIELRTGLINFSVIGRNCNREQRQQYIDYDRKSGERESMAIRLSAAFPELDFAIAGETGMDIYPQGKDKSQILQWFEDRPVMFFGDKTQPGGNDYQLALSVDLTHAVEDWQHTWELLRIIKT